MGVLVGGWRRRVHEEGVRGGRSCGDGGRGGAAKSRVGVVGDRMQISRFLRFFGGRAWGKMWVRGI